MPLALQGTDGMNGSPVEHYDEYDANGVRMQRSDSGREPLGTQRLLVYAGIAAGALALMAVVAFLWQQGTNQGIQTGMVLLQAEKGPIRVKPDSPGGQDAPDPLDIYDKLDGKQPSVPAETTAVAPEVEEPLPEALNPPAHTPGTQTATATVPPPPTATIAPPVLPDVAVPPAPQPPPVDTGIAPPRLPGEPAATAPATPTEGGSPLSGSLTDMVGQQLETPAPVQTAAATPALPASQVPPVPHAKPPVPVAARPTPAVTPPTPTAPPARTSGDDAFSSAPATAAPATTTPAAGGGSFIQLASVTSDAAARTTYAKMQKDHPRLAGLGLRVQTAPVNGTTYYRIQAGPVSPAQAQSICTALKAESLNCLVTK